MKYAKFTVPDGRLIAEATRRTLRTPRDGRGYAIPTVLASSGGRANGVLVKITGNESATAVYAGRIASGVASAGGASAPIATYPAADNALIWNRLADSGHDLPANAELPGIIVGSTTETTPRNIVIVYGFRDGC